MKSLKDFNYLLSLDRRYTKTESEIFRRLDALYKKIVIQGNTPAEAGKTLLLPFRGHH